MPRVIREHLRQRHTYHPEFRKCIIYQRYTLQMKNADISRVLNIPIRVVERVLQLWRNTGEVVMHHFGDHTKKVRLMIPDEVHFLSRLVERYPDMYQLQRNHGVIVGLSTIWNTLTELGLTHKKASALILSKAAAERNTGARAQYIQRIGHEEPDRLVFIDESRIDCRTTYRNYGWAHKGQRARIQARFVRGDGFSVLPALCSEGIIFSDVRRGAYDGKSFVKFIEALMPHMNVWPAPRSVLVMDNCAIHHVDAVRPICEAYGVRLYYLPPYSPDFNPIEEAFSYIKSVLRRHGAEFRAAVDTKDMASVQYLLHNALATITAEKACGWMEDSGYM